MNDKSPNEELRDYPILRALLTDQAEYTSLREKCLRTCRTLDDLIQSGAGEERESAQRILNAYGHALGFLDEIVVARDRVLEQHETGGNR
ncbi:MAG: hypothetical protein R3E97_13770 [Candidatus Eisenbacteria bacterium]